MDWKDYDAQTILQRVNDKAKPGSICLFHNAAKHTPEALPMIIERLQSDGYKIVPISKLIYKKNYTIDVAGCQIPNETTSVTQASSTGGNVTSTSQSLTTNKQK